MTAPKVRTPDGRHKRGEDSRARIVAAMLALVQEGEIAPGAEQVAARADVGLRTVFRHFNDMESLYREMSVAVEREVMAVVEQPFHSRDWRERVVELIARRAAVFETITPFKQASNAARHRSSFLEAANVRFVTIQRQILERELPATIAGDPLKLELLDLLLSYESWARLRQDQGLSPLRARATLEAAVRGLIA